MNSDTTLSRDSRESIALRPAWLLAGLLLASTIIHAWLLPAGVFGEQDAARLANSAIVAAATGRYRGADYTPHSSPLYLEMLRTGLHGGWLTPSDLPRFMGILSLLAAAGATLCLFVFVYRATRSSEAAIGAALLVQFAPVFWFNASYGFPSMVSLAVFLAGAVIWQHAVSSGHANGRYLLGVAALLVLLLASVLKVDSLLGGALYCLPIWQGSQTRRNKFVLSGALLLAGAGIFLLADTYGWLLAPVERTAFAWNTWEDRFPITLAALFGRVNLLTMLRAGGLLAIPAGLAAAAVVWRQRRQRVVLFWLSLTILPLTLFWGLRFGNSARHVLIPVVALYVLLALPLAYARGKAWAGALAALCLITYLAFPASPDTVMPSGRLIESTELLAQRASMLHARGAAIAERPEARLAVIGNGAEQPYYLYENLRRADPGSIRYEYQERGAWLQLTKGGREQTLLWIYGSTDEKTLDDLVGEGYLLLINDPSLVPAMQMIPSLAGKWLPVP